MYLTIGIWHNYQDHGSTQIGTYWQIVLIDYLRGWAFVQSTIIIIWSESRYMYVGRSYQQVVKLRMKSTHYQSNHHAIPINNHIMLPAVVACTGKKGIKTLTYMHIIKRIHIHPHIKVSFSKTQSLTMLIWLDGAYYGLKYSLFKEISLSVLLW